MRFMLRKDIAEARFVKSNNDMEDPYRLAPNTESFEPKRPKLLSESVDAKLEKSKTDTDDPICLVPKIEKVEPKRAMLRSDIADPRLAE